jgi:hypothetical protein
MMLENLTAYVLLALGGVLFVVIFGAYLKLRGVANGLLALAGEELHNSVNSLLQTSEELPESVLTYLDFMITVANASNGHWIAYRAFRRQNSILRKAVSVHSEKWAVFEKDLGSLRPELRQLINAATMMWLNWLVNRNVFSGLLIMFELRKMALDHGSLEAQPIDVERALSQQQLGAC